MKKLAIVGIFFDGYEDLWYDFVNLFNRNWPDCPYDCYIVNNVKEMDAEKCDISRFTVLHAGKDAEYSRKVQYAVDNIDADYYLLLLEDFYIVSAVSKEIFAREFEFIVRNNIEYYSMPMPEFVDIREKESVFNTENVFKISKRREYLLSCQPSVWKKDFLRLCIGTENYNAWVFEGIYAKTTFIRDDDFLKLSVVNYDNTLQLRHGALQGKMLPATLRIIKENGYEMTNGREMLSFKECVNHKVKLWLHMMIQKLGLEGIKKRVRKNSVLNRYKDEIERVARQTISEQKVKDYIEARDGE